MVRCAVNGTGAAAAGVASATAAARAAPANRRITAGLTAMSHLAFLLDDTDRPARAGFERRTAQAPGQPCGLQERDP
jgi:hypothetical protein